MIAVSSSKGAAGEPGAGPRATREAELRGEVSRPE